MPGCLTDMGVEGVKRRRRPISVQPGINRTAAARVFDMFRRLDGNGVPGTGFGLALCKKVVERHGGRIWVETDVTQGAAFRFTLPIYLDTALPGFSTAELANQIS